MKIFLKIFLAAILATSALADGIIGGEARTNWPTLTSYLTTNSYATTIGTRQAATNTAIANALANKANLSAQTVTNRNILVVVYPTGDSICNWSGNFYYDISDGTEVSFDAGQWVMITAASQYHNGSTDVTSGWPAGVTVQYYSSLQAVVNEPAIRALTSDTAIDARDAAVAYKVRTEGGNNLWSGNPWFDELLESGVEPHTPIQSWTQYGLGVRAHSVEAAGALFSSANGMGAKIAQYGWTSNIESNVPCLKLSRQNQNSYAQNSPMLEFYDPDPNHTGDFIYVNNGIFRLNRAGYVMTPAVVLTPKSSSPPSDPTEGTIHFDTDTKHFFGFNGTIWKQLDN